MEKVHKPKRLIKFTSESSISTGVSHLFNWRTRAYSVVLILLLGILILLIASRKNIDTTILRSPGLLFQQPDSMHYSNLFLIKTINKTYDDANLKIVVAEPTEAVVKSIGRDIKIKAESKYDGQFFLVIPNNQMTGHQTKVVLDIYRDGEKIERVKTNFLGPIYNQ
jgi:hypothetical protein